ncbi:MAG: hypothetical protein KAH86_04015, partial [Methanosarcinales archaeon]|nr:hypothetical protein [Methanosarcinales archaeon]
PDQDVPGSDGIGDTLHSISGGSGAIDSYPYVDENGWDADTTPPTVAITSHVGGQIVTTSSITIAGTASDDSGIEYVYVSVNNHIFAAGTTHWNADITLAEGTNIIFVTAIDTAENRASDIISVIYAPVAANIVELKGKVANTTDIADIFSYNTNIVWSASNFAGFYHDSDYGIGSESLTILHDVANFNGDTTNLSSLGNDNRTIFEDHLVYDTITEAKRFEYEAFGNYSIIGIIGEPYFAGYLDVSTQIESNTKKVTSGRSILENGVLSKVLIDSDDKYTIATGDGLELKEGYVLNIQQVDLENNKAFIELVKDGKVIDADVAYPGQNTSLSDDIYVYDGTGLGDKDDYPLIIARIDVVFRGADTNAVVIEGLFQISDTTMEVSTGYEYGMMVVTDTTSSTIRMKNREYPIYLERDSAKTVMGDMMFKVVDNDALSFYPFTILVNPQVSTIAEPDEHAYVKGNIDIIGTAKGADFRNYAVELKNATDWMWIYPSTTPVTDGILTTLDTIGLADGAYVIRLNVIDEGYNTKSSSVNITIDNTKPTVTDISVSTSTPVINTSVNITARVSDFNLNNSSIFISGPNGFINNTPMTDPDDDVYSLDFTKISGYGRYDVTIIASDFVGNINDTETISFVTVMPPYVNESIDTTANNTTLIDALGEANATLDLVTSSDTTGGTLNITMSNEMPPQLNQSFELSALGKYISLNPSGDLNANIAWAIIKIYYTDAELAASSLDETSLVLRYYNETSGMWELIGPSGVNTNPVVIDNYSYSGYVWANVSHFSYYGAGGELEGEAGNGDSGNSGGNSGGGGGGGGSNEPSANIEINQVEYLQNIVKDTTTDYSFAEPKTPVTGVSFYTQMIPSRAVEVR